MTRFSANLGFLWAELALPDAIAAAAAAGFDAVECHWPYDTPAEQTSAALERTGLQLLGLNTRRGDVGARENGLSALPGREADARAAIDEAISYATVTRTPNIHVMAGFAVGRAAHDSFLENLAYATRRAAPHGITILIEPLNGYDAPGYFLRDTEQAAQIIRTLGAENLKLMFDCYHVQLTEGDLSNRIRRLLPITGHVQFAGVPARGRPDQGEIAYGHIFNLLAELGHEAPLGAEYKPGGPTEGTLGWMRLLRAAA